jgi:hypothetical protein
MLFMSEYSVDVLLLKNEKQNAVGERCSEMYCECLCMYLNISFRLRGAESPGGAPKQPFHWVTREHFTTVKRLGREADQLWLIMSGTVSPLPYTSSWRAI